MLPSLARGWQSCAEEPGSFNFARPSFSASGLSTRTWIPEAKWCYGDMTETTKPIARVALRPSQNPEQSRSGNATRRATRIRRPSGLADYRGVHRSGISSSKESRPALNRLMSNTSRRRFDAVLIWKIDRFGRSLKHLVNALAELAALGATFVSSI